jgi:hypothetical protein
MNFKYILIIVILIVILGGEILTYQYWLTPQQGVMPPEEVLTDETSNWKTYKNQKWGYEINYPPNFYFYEISPGNVLGVHSESMSFQEEGLGEAWEWPGFEVEIFRSDNLSLLSWLQEKWLEYDIPMNTDAFRENFEQIIKQRKEITVNNYQAIRLPHSYDESVYFFFISNNGGSVAKLTCVLYGEDISEICDKAFATFRFLK